MALTSETTALPEGVQRVSIALRAAGHDTEPLLLQQACRTSQEAADALGVSVGQIAKSVIFRRASDGAHVMVVAAGDRRVDERKVTALVGPIGKADAAFVRERTGYAIGGVSPVAHAQPPVVLLDESLQRFDTIWAAAGHPNSVFRLRPADLQRLTGAAFADVAQEPAT
jgi:prolyl-tRNA editing enzyme YbaK/EbsC (Cys-tRNA(Pro) deacylase)